MSKKQQARDRAYKIAKIERAEELKAEGKWVCFFTGEPIPDYLTGDKVPVHHLIGRKEDDLVDKKFFAFYLYEECHKAIHEMEIEKLVLQPWWSVYMANLKETDSDLYYHWKLREEEAQRR